MPPDVQLDPAWDWSIFIDRSIADVRTTIFESVALVVLVIYLFLRSIRDDHPDGGHPDLHRRHVHRARLPSASASTR